MGDTYVFRLADAQARLLALGTDVSSEPLESVVSALLARVHAWSPDSGPCVVADPPDHIVYVVPELGDHVTSISVMRAQVIANLGQWEQLAHVLHGVAKGSYSGTPDAAECAAFGARVVAAWEAWWADTTTAQGLSIATKNEFWPGLTYTKVAVSYVTYRSEGESDRFTVNVPTVYTNFSAGQSGGAVANSALPLEVASCMTLLTNDPTPRHRGRTYLGGIAKDVMDGTTGLFLASFAGVAARWGEKVVNGLSTDAASNWNLAVVSRKYATARAIGGVKHGVVPDSQRRRRRSQPENSALVWGSAA